jgi:hypothetical protein
VGIAVVTGQSEGFHRRHLRHADERRYARCDR